MPKFKVTMAEPGRFFPAYGHLKDGDVIDVAEQPADGVVWSWAPADDGAEPVASEPVVPDSALPPVFAGPADEEDARKPDVAAIVRSAADGAKAVTPEPPTVPDTSPAVEQA